MPPSLQISDPERRESSANPQRLEMKALQIHGHSLEEYRKVYSTVVKHMLKNSSGNPKGYSLELGPQIKQRLWEVLSCPLLVRKRSAPPSTSCCSNQTAANIAKQ
ncbi:hypothetical protein EOD39_5125 [Acipenser ruthenus]|uniref:Uncharacterized protein n=1 Tax=Acipenser ruthenus TaxID=7906 RepID=A0A444UFN2_ACIRT|nr:uncharacterized protein C22orf31-like [Acipenser ruthenus]RXM33898.1 hypothetical protein EOD39_5125 [Acipenser ruthenus]